MKILSRRPAAKAARPFGIAPERAETLLAGALLLAGASRVLGTAFKLGNGGLREGAALEAVALKILDEHVRHCVAGALTSGDEADAATKTEELIEAVQRFARTR